MTVFRRIHAEWDIKKIQLFAVGSPTPQESV